jgi:hypothetical protein
MPVSLHGPAGGVRRQARRPPIRQTAPVDARDLDRIVALERAVWDALCAGDTAADTALLSPDFLGVYPTGFADREEHAAPLAGGPTVASYEISDARITAVADGAVMLSYRAEYVRAPDRGAAEAMYVSSLWCRRDRRWVNTFSQDTPVGAAVV